MSKLAVNLFCVFGVFMSVLLGLILAYSPIHPLRWFREWRTLTKPQRLWLNALRSGKYKQGRQDER